MDLILNSHCSDFFLEFSNTEQGALICVGATVLAQLKTHSVIRPQFPHL